jgi:lysophospholipase L1-like esterase
MMLQKNDKILFQGDSITNAFRKPEEVGTSYRLGSGWVMLVAAQLQAEHPDLDLQIENRGICGNGVSDLLERWECDCIEWKPTVLSLLVGVNNTIRYFRYGEELPVVQFEASYRTLLDRTRQALPEIRLILCEPFLLETGAVTAAWRDHLRSSQEVVRQLAASYGAVFVPLQKCLDEAAAKTGPAYWLFDGVHPNASGQWLIMQAWRRNVLPIIDDSLRAP